jgi:two-component system, LytTR family, sensor kinase
MGKHIAKKIKKQTKALTFILVIGIVVPLYYVLYAIFNDKPVPQNSTWWGETIITFCLTLVLASSLYLSSGAIARQLEKVLPWREEARKRFVAEFFLISITAIAISGLIGFLFYYYFTYCEDPGPIIFDIIIKSWVINTIATAIYEGVFFLNQWKAALVNAEKLKKENLQSQFDSLKNQVNPHFLFNSLNTLATIIPEDPEQAVKFVQKLSSVYRYLLQYKDNETVDLQTELDCIHAYFFLQKIRFGENLQVNIDVPHKYQNRQIPPLTLQILVENAIKHNIVSQHKPLTVHIYIDDAGMLVTRNTLQKKKSVESSTKIGLQNLMNRFTYIFDQGIDIFETDTDFIVKVPLG